MEGLSWLLWGCPCFGDARQPPLQCVIIDLLRVNPSGVVKTRIHPHRMVSGLKRLDAPLEENLQEIHTGDPVTDKLDHLLDQHPHLRLLLREGFLTRSMEKGGSPVDCPGIGWSLQYNQVDCHPRTESGRIMVGKALFPLN